MNSNFLLALTIGGACAIATAEPQPSGGGYRLESATLDGGGGNSAGGEFTLAGTIGQPDAALALRGGEFTLEPGFWSSLTVITTPGAPRLKIRLLAGNQAIISWPRSVTGFGLEKSGELASGNWTAETTAVVDTDDEHTVTLPATGWNFFRLKKSP
jgi:hypothetical protein